MAAGLVPLLGDPGHLLAFCVASAGLMLGLIVVTARRFPDELGVAPQRVTTPVVSGKPRRRGTWWALLGNRMVVLILAYQLLSAAVTQLLDYMVWERAAARYPDPSDLAQFQGLFGAVINVVSVLFVVAFAGWLLTRFGVGFGLAANPFGVLVLLVASTAVGYTTGAVALTFFARSRRSSRARTRTTYARRSTPWWTPAMTCPTTCSHSSGALRWPAD